MSAKDERSRPAVTRTHMTIAEDGLTIMGRLHERVLAGDYAAREATTRELLSILRPRLHSAFPRADRDAVSDAVEDAILEYLSRPQRFDATRRVPLAHFIFVIARRRLLNRIRNDSTQVRAEQAYVVSSAGALLQPACHANDENDDRCVWARHLLACVTDPRERAALQFWLDEAPITDVARALGFTDLSVDEQRREVKRFKDRIRQRLRDRWQREHAKTAVALAVFQK